MDRATPSSRITAVLGPTNTGKTHFAMERMLAHRSGMMGFPLRLLARENYDRALKIKGAHAVALVTGEEKIVPPGASYFLCTVEAMPTDRQVEFLAVDEVQLAADAERGHVFTERMLHARGRVETMFVGAETIRRLLRQLVPKAAFVTRPRLSKLTYAGPKRLTRLPSRTAVVGFSAAEVYSLAEMMRRRRGGAAVVLGALSPRTRNAQVEMYQAGEVDYLVATDAIGMGLNMDINHVAFSRLRKFDGRATRALTHAEVAQIAGRAGRNMNDGTFGTTAGLEPFGPEAIEAVEGHEFPSIKHIYWRNTDLSFDSPPDLLRSLTESPPAANLIPAREAEDFQVLASLARQAPIKERAGTRAAVRLLWEVCQIPDFRKIMSDAHVRLLGRIYRDLTSDRGRIDTDWIARQVDRIDRTTGDIGTLVGRIADIRTWTYVSHRDDWLDDGTHWQERTRAIEDRLSDALHERLTQRFVDRRTAVLVRRMRDRDDLSAVVGQDGDVLVEGEFVGRLDGFRFVADGGAGREDARALQSAATRALRLAIVDRIRRLEKAPEDTLTLDRQGTVLWHGEPVGKLAPGRQILAPRIEPVSSDLLDTKMRRRVEKRLVSWFEALLRHRLGPLLDAQEASLTGAARGLVFQLAEGLGSVSRRQVSEQIAALTKAERKALARAGIRLGQFSVYLPQLLDRQAAEFRALIWSAHTGQATPDLPWGRHTMRLEGAPEDAFAGSSAESLLAACGYRATGSVASPVTGPVAVRVDRLEALALAVRKLARQGPFGPTPALLTVVGCSEQDFPAVMALLGYRWIDDGAGGRFERRSGRRKAARRKSAGKRGDKETANPCSPFAVLKQLTVQE